VSLTDHHGLAKPASLMRSTPTAWAKPVQDYSTQLLLARTSQSLEPMSPMHLRKPPHQSKVSLFILTETFLAGGFTTRNSHPSCQALSFESYPQCRGTQSPLASWRSMPTTSFEILASGRLHTSRVSTQVPPKESNSSSNGKLTTLPSRPLMSGQQTFFSTYSITSSPSL
jgi:hypothetical protein